MKLEVSAAIEELRRQFPDSAVIVRDDGRGGAYVIIEPVSLGPRYLPERTWAGFQIPAQYPYADIYPVFIGAETKRADGRPFSPPITRGRNFEGRPSLQVSRRSRTGQNGLQRATAKVLKVLDFLGRIP